jgi:ribosomal protein L7/L12
MRPLLNGGTLGRRETMPVDFGCDGCGLRFSIGWYHYHSIESGYLSSTLAVCERCGTQHRIEQALDLSTWRSSHFFFDVTIADVPSAARVPVSSRLRELRSLTPKDAIALVNSLPILLGRDLPEHRAQAFKSEYEALGAVVTLTETREEVVPLPTQQHDRLLVGEPNAGDVSVAWRPLDIRGSVTALNEVFNLNEQACGHCSAVGGLVTDWTHAPQSCPQCHSLIQQTGGWVT